MVPSLSIVSGLCVGKLIHKVAKCPLWGGVPVKPSREQDESPEAAAFRWVFGPRLDLDPWTASLGAQPCGSWDHLMHSGQEICGGKCLGPLPRPFASIKDYPVNQLPSCSDTAWICCPPGHSAELICALRIPWREGGCVLLSVFGDCNLHSRGITKIRMSSYRFSDLQMWFHL